jgi:hypothetical protein
MSATVLFVLLQGLNRNWCLIRPLVRVHHSSKAAFGCLTFVWNNEHTKVRHPNAHRLCFHSMEVADPEEFFNPTVLSKAVIGCGGQYIAQYLTASTVAI